MTMLQSYFNHKIEKKEVFRLYWEKLNQITNLSWDMAVNNILEDFQPTATNPFPLIKDFYKYSGQDPHNMGVNAVSLVRKAVFSKGVYSSVDFGDPIVHSVISRYGGWIEICNWTEEDWKFKESGFIRAYESAAINPLISSPKHLAGIHENNNGKSVMISYVGADKKPKLELKSKKTLTKEKNEGF